MKPARHLMIVDDRLGRWRPARLRAALRNHGEDPELVAAAAGISVETLAAWCQDTPGVVPRWDQACLLGEALWVMPEFFYAVDPTPPTRPGQPHWAPRGPGEPGWIAPIINLFGHPAGDQPNQDRLL